MEPCPTDHPQHLVLHSSGKGVKEPPNQDHQGGDGEAMALGSSRNWHEAPLAEGKSHLWKVAAALKTHKISVS